MVGRVIQQWRGWYRSVAADAGRVKAKGGRAERRPPHDRNAALPGQRRTAQPRLPFSRNVGHIAADIAGLTGFPHLRHPVKT